MVRMKNNPSNTTVKDPGQAIAKVNKESRDSHFQHFLLPEIT